MRIGEPHPFPERGSPTRRSASGQQSYKGETCSLSYGISNESDGTTSVLLTKANSHKIKPIKIKHLVSVHSIQLRSYHAR